MLEDEGKAMLLMPSSTTRAATHDALYRMLSHPDSIVGLADGGAHCGLICDASTPTYMLTALGAGPQPRPAPRARARRPQADLRYRVLYGLGDRGVIAAGKRAD